MAKISMKEFLDELEIKYNQVTLPIKKSRTDLWFSEALIPLSTFIGGLGLYLTIKVSWTLFPFIPIAFILYGLRCRTCI